jgi:serine/threonine protein kinase
MSEVFLARRADGGPPVALKRLYPSADAEWVAAMQEEADLVRRLAHPGIVRVLDSGMIEGSLFVVYELVDGRDLAEVLERARAADAKPPLAFALSVALSILKGLAYVHGASNGAEKALVHRDVAPSNILVGFDGGAKLTDFGIAHEAGRTTRRTQEGLVKGTARYLSPEQARGAELDATSDLFSFGCVLAEMLTGAPLHAGDMRAQINQTMNNLEVVLQKSGYTLADVVRLHIYTTDLEGFQAAYDTFAGRLAEGDCRPACSMLGVAGLAIPTMLIEIEATAVR